jgi:hypothetical protein
MILNFGKPNSAVDEVFEPISRRTLNTNTRPKPARIKAYVNPFASHDQRSNALGPRGLSIIIEYIILTLHYKQDQQ